jgi:hypothetical protein
MAHRIRQIAKQRSADPTDNLVPQCVVLERLVFISIHNLDSTLSRPGKAVQSQLPLYRDLIENRTNG